MRVLILGVAGTFMAGVAQLALAKGFEVQGVDAVFYPPMSDVLADAGVPVHQGWDHALRLLQEDWACVVVGNALSRGQPVVEALLDRGLPYTSGPDFIARYVLAGRQVLAVAGTHGKTTTSSILAWLFKASGRDVGYLIGGQPIGFEASAHLGTDPIFVIEADEYDSAFFDKRPKMLHYKPHALIVGNLEFDHADIYPNLEAIQQQFIWLMRTVPASGYVVVPDADAAVDAVLDAGCWSSVQRFATQQATQHAVVLRLTEGTTASRVALSLDGQTHDVAWDLSGVHNRANAAAAVGCARACGVSVPDVCAALASFKGVRRRLEYKGMFAGARLYDDFAHHPTAVAHTLKALRMREPGKKIWAVLQLGSFTMCSGVHAERLPHALDEADAVFLLASRPAEKMLKALKQAMPERITWVPDADALAQGLQANVEAGDCIIMMGNQDLARWLPADEAPK